MAEPEQQQEPRKELEKIAWEDIKKHNTSSSLWIVVHNTIYDVTKFMEEVSHEADCLGGGGPQYA